MKYSYTFLFNADDNSLGSSLCGPVFFSKLSDALKKEPNLETRILYGDAIIHSMSREMSSFTSKNSTTSYTLSTNKEIHNILIHELYLSITKNQAIAHNKNLLLTLFENSIYCITLTTITPEQEITISHILKKQPYYLGSIKLDIKNPIQTQLFIDSLYDNIYYKDHFIYESYSDNDDFSQLLLEDQKVKTVRTGYLKGLKSQAPITNPLSNSGSQSISILEKFNLKYKKSYNHRLIKSILDYLDENKSSIDFSYKGKELKPKDFNIPDRKLTDYLLNLEHPEGKTKAKFFIDNLAIQPDDWLFLKNQIIHAMGEAPIIKLKCDQYGYRHSSLINIKGRNNKTATLECCWQIKPETLPVFITAFPYKKESKTKNSFFLLASKNMPDSEKFNYIYKLAEAKAQESVNAFSPNPIIINGQEVCFAGLCGRAYVVFPDARTKVARWLKNNNIGHKSYLSGWEIPMRPIPKEDDLWDYFSWEARVKYAETFAQIWKDHGIPCTVNEYLD